MTKQVETLAKLSRHGLIFLLSAVLLSESVAATQKNQRLQIAQQPENTQHNATRAAVTKLWREGMERERQGTAESLRQARDKYQQALKLLQQIDEKRGQALTLIVIGNVYFDLEEKQQALKYYNQALTIFVTLKDEKGQAGAFLIIGSVYSDLGEKQQALKYYNQALTIFRKEKDKGKQAITLNNIGTVYADLGEKQQALKYHNQALALQDPEKDKGGVATTLNNIGTVYFDLGEKQQALKYYNQALALARAVMNRKAEATTLNNIGTVYSSLGEKQQALKYHNQAQDIYLTVEDKGGLANTLNNIGAVYNSLGEKQQALKYHNQALTLYRAVEDRGGEATTLTGIGNVYESLGEKQQALKYYNQALSLHRAVEDKGGEATTLNNLGTVHDSLGEKQEALKYYKQAIALRRAVEDKGGQAQTLNNLGFFYDSLGEKQQALKYLNQALTLYRDLEDKGGQATTLNNLGKVYDDLDEKQQALSYYNQALPLSRAVGDRGTEAITLNNIGLVYSSLGEKQQALKYLKQALALKRGVGDRAGEATTLNNFGNVYESLGEKQKAFSYYNQALPLYRAVGDRSGEANTLYNMAYLELKQDNLQPARTHIQAAIDIIEDLRTKIDDQQLRTSYFASVQTYYRLYIHLLMQLHKKDPSQGYNALALHISERSRARSLVELLTEARAGIRKDIDPKLLAEEQRLLQLINASEKQRFEILNSPKIQQLPDKNLADKLQTQITDLRQQYQQLQTQIRTTSPKYADLVYPQPLTLPQIQQQLDKDTLLLQYSLGEERSYLWAVTPDSINTYELPKRADIEAAAENFYKLLQNRGNLLSSTRGIQPVPTDISKSQHINSATKLSQLILSPVANQLGKKRLVIVADGTLQMIPFAALPDLTQVGNQTEANYQPLLVNHEIVHLPSMTAIATQRTALKGRKTAPKTLAVLADPVFAATDQRVTGQPEKIVPDLDLSVEELALQRAAKNLNRNSWGRIPGTRQEAETILKMVAPQQRVQAFDFDANFDWVTNPQLSQYRFIHLATHGFADSQNPELSGIVLSLVDKAGQPINRQYLRLRDIFNLNFPADLVVLSACETGLGQNVNGEGLVGLTRGFMYAGAERLAVSLWKVDDTGTSQLMQKFYQQMLQQDKSPNIALRDAQLKMWQQDKWRNPYFWSAFIFQGEWR
ncbi:CHAT domain-containing tetratricopeptide repeat protein [Nostoc sp. UHCC 0870]|uniref:CHAT domain-containing tetratricopeptide repeat protein n=1 Tax=Nostoc sp. UHCC 0870 TaxID=2914041 RepID=UPI001EDD25CD|nr:CHAT domain-containing tetratricopeptide repeat protein [Nostoc sp. UHCC 0870]UKO99722.1 CHAT domain-containing protein [Nostoc sp. UHCC 0870]